MSAHNNTINYRHVVGGQLKVMLVILVLLNIISCEGKNSSAYNEYNFDPIGWHFNLPYNWVVQKDLEINKAIVKHKSNLGLSEEEIQNFKEGKLFFLKTNEGFHRFTSEMHPFSGSNYQFEVHANGLIEQSVNQLKGITPQADIKVIGSTNISISETIFKKSNVIFKFEANANNYFEMGIYIGRFQNKFLTISYTCIKGDKQCIVARDAIESSVFKKI